MEIENHLQRARVLQAKDLGGKVQLICQDEFGLLSAYLDYEPFCLFTRILCQAGLQLKGALIEFNRDLVRVSMPGDRWQKLATTVT